MTVAATITALQAANLAIAGINSAPDTFPSNTSQLKAPFALTFAGPATWNLAAIGLRRQERAYRVRCYVQEIAQGMAGPDTGYQATEALLEKFGQAYLTDPTLGGAVDTMNALSDTGVQDSLMWAQAPWWGFEYTITVTEKSA